MKIIAIGVDIGGSHISCAAVDLQQKAMLHENVVTARVNNQASAGEILDNWAQALTRAMGQIDPTQLAGIGFAMPGPFDYAEGIARFNRDVAKYQNLFGVDISGAIRDRLGLPPDFELRYLNDASAFGVGEAWRGRAVTSKRSISITLGTGLGAAFVDDGVPVVDGDLVPRMGSMWHLPFNDGIADAAFSTRRFVERYARKTGEALDGVKALAARAATDPRATEVFGEFGTNLGRFMGAWVKNFAAEILVIGGNISAAYDLFGPALEASFNQQQISSAIAVSELKEAAAAIGSARLFEDRFWKRIKPLLAKM